MTKTFRTRTKELWDYFTTYEKVWFFSILILAVIFSFLFPEEDINGVNGKLIMLHQLAPPSGQTGRRNYRSS